MTSLCPKSYFSASRYLTLHCSTLLCVTLHSWYYTNQRYTVCIAIPTWHCPTWHCATLRRSTLPCVALHSPTLFSETFHYMTSLCPKSYFSAFLCLTLHCSTLLCVTLHSWYYTNQRYTVCIAILTSHCPTLHCLRSHCQTFAWRHYIAPHCKQKNLRYFSSGELPPIDEQSRRLYSFHFIHLFASRLFYFLLLPALPFCLITSSL